MGYLSGTFVDTIVYWSLTGQDGAGNLTYASPIEIKGRWVQRSEIFVSHEMKNEACQAVIFLESQDTTVDSMMYKGELTDLTTEQKVNPNLVSDAFPIRAIKKEGSLNGQDFLRKVWL